MRTLMSWPSNVASICPTSKFEKVCEYTNLDPLLHGMRCRLLHWWHFWLLLHSIRREPYWWAVPSNGELLYRNGVACSLVNQFKGSWPGGVASWLTQSFWIALEKGLEGLVWQVEEHLLAVSRLFLGSCSKGVQTHTPWVSLGIVYCFLEERSELDQLVASIKEATKEKL
jgi:hypothetical protein